MANEIIPVYQKEMLELESGFLEIASKHGAIDFKSEVHFACQAMGNNSYLASTAQSNPQSMRNAVMNIAAIGISLNPALKLAYLVPRDGKVCLDISYGGLIKLAVDVGSISWATAEIVYAMDNFELKGFSEPPKHNRNPFSKERGEIVGVYCVAKTTSGDYLTTTMSKDEIDGIMKRSSGYKAVESGKAKSSPWHTDYCEMSKKTVIKRAAKLWPHSGEAYRLQNAIETLNKEEGIDFNEEQKVVSDYRPIDYAKKNELVKKISFFFSGMCANKDLQEKGSLMVKYCKINKWDQIKNKTEEELEQILEDVKNYVAPPDIVVTTKDIPFTDENKDV